MPPVPTRAGHAAADTFVPRHHSERLYQAYAGDKASAIAWFRLCALAVRCRRRRDAAGLLCVARLRQGPWPVSGHRAALTGGGPASRPARPQNLVLFEGDHNSVRPDHWYTSAMAFLCTTLRVEELVGPWAVLDLSAAPVEALPHL